MQFLLIRKHPDGTEESSDYGLGAEYARVGQPIPGDAPPGKTWEVRKIHWDTDPLPTIVTELVDDDLTA